MSISIGTKRLFTLANREDGLLVLFILTEARKTIDNSFEMMK